MTVALNPRLVLPWFVLSVTIIMLVMLRMELFSFVPQYLQAKSLESNPRQRGQDGISNDPWAYGISA